MDEGLSRIEEPQEEQIRRTNLGDGPRPRSNIRRYVIAGVALALGLFSFFVLGKIFSDPATYRATIEALDEKRNTVMSLMAASTGTSAAISLLPGDAGTPIAEKLIDLSSNFLVVISAIYLEKYLLTILGLASFKVLVPVACLLFSVASMIRDQLPAREILARLGAKLLLFGVTVCLVVPISVRISGLIEQTYQASIDQTIQTAENTSSAIEQSAGEGQGTTDESNPLSFLLNVPDELQRLTDEARQSLSNFVEALAVMIVTSCIIPVLVLAFFIWLMQTILGINFDIPLTRSRYHK